MAWSKMGGAGSRIIDLRMFSEDAAQSELAAKLVAASPTLTVTRLEDAYKSAKSPEEAEVLKAMIVAAKTGRPQGALKLVDAQAAQATAESETQKHYDHALVALDSMVIGQQSAKDSVARFYATYMSMPKEQRRNGPARAFLFTGPPGVGKTEMAAAVAYLFNRDRKKLLKMDCAEIQKMEHLARELGSPPGYQGSGDTGRNSSISHEKFGATFSDDDVPLIVLDEVDKIGKDPSNPVAEQAVKTAFFNVWNGALDTNENAGMLKFYSGETLSLKGAVIIMTSNAGADAPGVDLLSGEASDKHYNDAAAKLLPIQMKSRVRTRIAFRPHTVEHLAEIAKVRLDKIAENLEAAARTQRGVDVDVEVDADAAKLIAECVAYPGGSRSMSDVVQDLVAPIAHAQQSQLQDEERWTLRLKPSLTRLEREKLAQRFIQNAPTLPNGVSSDNFPVELVCTNPKPVFYGYSGGVPHSDIARPLIMASGALAGRGFLLYNQGESSSPTELCLLKPGATEAKDSWQRIKLPAALKNANVAIDAVALDDTKLYLHAINIADGAAEATTCAYVYDHVKKAFEEAAPPPLALIGATVASAGGKVLMVGGRALVNDGEAWSVKTAEEDGENPNNGEAIENIAWLFDPQGGEWQPLEQAPARGRAGAAAVVRDGRIWLLGGEEIVRQANGVNVSRASSAVEIFDPETGTFSAGPELPTPTAFAKSFVDGSGRINLCGGVDYVDFGSQATAKDSFLRLDPSATKSVWKARDTLPAPGSQLAVVPHAKGMVIGPFYDELEPLTPRFAILK